MKKQYYLTADLESTAMSSLTNNPHVATKVLEDIRHRILTALEKALGNDVNINLLSYDEICSWFKHLNRPNEEFIISVEDGIYVKKSDFFFSSTRMYANEGAILNDKNNYQILTRSGGDITNQCNQLNHLYASKSNGGGMRVVLCDDGIFSGKTLQSLVDTIHENSNLRIGEIRVVGNFSGKKDISGIPILAKYTGECIDWIDERDFFYGTRMGGASVMDDGKISGIPYISSLELLEKKASIPEGASAKLCQELFRVNNTLWNILGEDTPLEDIPRLAYLQEKGYTKTDSIGKILGLEMYRVFCNENIR